MPKDRFRIGEICRKEHEDPDHPGFGLRYISNGYCVECQRSAKRSGKGKIRGSYRPKVKDDAERLERQKADNRRRYHEEGGKERNQAYREANPELARERVRASMKKRREDPKKHEIDLERNRVAYAKDPAKAKECSRKYNLKPETLKKQRDYEKGRYATDEQFMMRKRLRANFRSALRGYTETGKAGTSRSYGIDYNAIIVHLGSCPGDTAEWHIDHIRPLVSFDLTDLEQIREAFAPENHQWLPATDNMSKGAKF